MRVTPPPKWPVEHRNVRALHGLVTGLVGVPHTPMQPRWSLIPSARGVGWGLYLQEEDLALKLAGRQWRGVLFDREVLITCGPLHRVKSPRVTKRGHRKLRVDAITPVCLRNDGQRTYMFPTASNVLSTLCTWLPPRLGLPKQEHARLLLVERHTTPQRVPLGGKYGMIAGWVGHVIVDCNAITHWLLLAAETLGVGGRSAFGFGRIRVSDA